jgi:SWI/SNF-related matrix-associated actin-dependent regulator of chromatin subfamily A3
MICTRLDEILNSFSSHTGQTLNTSKYHGHDREKDASALGEYDVVITTYNTLASEYSKKESVLHRVSWYRIVLDEGKGILQPALNNCVN